MWKDTREGAGSHKGIGRIFQLEAAVSGKDVTEDAEGVKKGVPLNDSPRRCQNIGVACEVIVRNKFQGKESSPWPETEVSGEENGN